MSARCPLPMGENKSTTRQAKGVLLPLESLELFVGEEGREVLKSHAIAHLLGI